MKRKHTLLLSLFLMLFLSNCKDKTPFIPEEVAIYANTLDLSKNYYTLDIQRCANNDLLLISVSSNGSARSRLDGLGTIFLQKINKYGTTLWIDSISVSSWFSNVLHEVSGTKDIFRFFTFGNKTKFEEVAFSLEGSAKPVFEPIHTVELNISDYFSTIAVANKVKGGYLLLGTAREAIEAISYSKSYILQLDENAAYKKLLSEHEFYPNAFDPAVADDFSYLYDMENYFIMDSVNGKVFYHAPVNSQMQLRTVGETLPMFADNNYGFISLLVKSDSTFSVIAKNPKIQGETWLIPNFDSKLREVNFDYVKANLKMVKIEKINTNYKIAQLELPNKNIAVIGTMLSGQIMVAVYNENGERLNQRLIGQTYPYEVAGVQLLENENCLVIAGTTRMEYTYQRSFFVRISLDAL